MSEDRKSNRLSRLYYDEDPKSLAAQIADKNVKKKKEKIPKITPFPKIGYEDMTKMEDMDLDGVLGNLKERYENDLIYTYTSSILVAINPFKRLDTYNKGWVKYYKGHRLGKLSPHIFAVAEQTYNSMVETESNQSVLVSGESGAGKTESTKLILQFLSARTDRESNIETMVLESIPVLEAFGNAKTGRNDNSSRFGKFIEIQFDSDHYICGSKITPYLLEKSRLITQGKGERNYHIFYQLTEGAPQELKDQLFLKGAKEYSYLNQSGCYTIKKINESEELEQLKSAMDLFEISEEIQLDIFKIVATCLHLGNIVYTQNGEESKPKDGASQEALQHVATLMDIDPEKLEYALTHRKIKMRSEVIHKPLTPGVAKDQTNSLVKFLFGEMFVWLVKKLNESTYSESSVNFIGVLDIFGFEVFEHNTFEQFLINYANEKLQNFFNHHIFKLEQVEYEREGIDWTAIDFVDNQPCLDLIEMRRPPGILAILDEESKFPRATDETFYNKLIDNFAGKHEYFDKPKLARTKFFTKHFAGNVEYEITGWRDKNKDELPEHLTELIRSSENKFITILYTPSEDDEEENSNNNNNKKKGKLTLGGQFKNQLVDLMTMLGETSPYFIRCVKSNMEKVANKFDDKLIYGQLLYAGMLETIKIRRMGYPIRFKNEDFFRRFRVICPEVPMGADVQASCTALCNALGIKAPTNYQLGKTKVFLKQDMSNELEERRNVALTDIIVKVQTWWRGIFPRYLFNQKRQKSIVIQTWWRYAYWRGKFLRERAAATKIALWWKMAAAMKLKAELAEQKRVEEEERKRKEEEERQKMIKEMGEEKVKALEEEKKKEVEAAQAAEEEKIRALASGEISFGEGGGKEEPEDVPNNNNNNNNNNEEEDKKKKKKKKKKEKLKKDARGSIMMKKGATLEVPINVDGRITLGLGWKGGQWDMDASCLMFRFKQHRDDVYYYKPKSKDNSVTHRGGYAGLIRINPEEGDAEQIDINLSRVSAKTNTLLFVVTVFSPEGNFSSVQDAYVRLLDTNTQVEYCRYTLESSGNETARIMCRLYRYGYSKWRLQAIGEPSQGRLYKHMIPRVEPFLDDMPPRRKFRIRIHRGKLNDIKRMYKGKSGKTSVNTYCEVRFDTDKAKSKVIKKSLTPQWRSTVEVKGYGTVLEVNVMHKVRFGNVGKKSLFLGRCLIPLTTENVQIQETWFKLEQRDKSRDRGRTAVTGEIKLTIQEFII
eukprot:TRINITY_DN341_c0_g6_i1.p1 TRINITY_DN341_c0_g6~~TRINITY_DN341_c0_g6_i1.p1  ORF type:complete len:1226 (-),score=527.54 TRINITY_DN341_c0_g6_i1:73-3750(-)